MAVYLGPAFAFALIAFAQEARVLHVRQIASLVALVTIGALAGLRFECGQDWPAYEMFFDNLDAKVGPWESVTSHNSLPAFEVGFHVLNWIVKWLGGSYSVVMLLASMFCVFGLYMLLAELPINRFYVLTTYASYSYLILQFAQVRQSIAVGLMLLACLHYARYQLKLPALAIVLSGALFQLSAIMYMLTFLASIYWPSRPRTAAVLAMGIASALFAVRNSFDFYAVLSAAAVFEFAQSKVDIYQEFQDDSSGGTMIVAGYLVLQVIYLIRYAPAIDERFRFIAKFGIASTLLTLIMIAIFPNSYVMFSRAYVISSILMSAGMALVFARVRGLIHECAFAVTTLVALAYCLRVVLLNLEAYLPYRTILGNMFHQII
jgi:EpsG family